MSETRRKFNRDFREGAVRLVLETGQSVDRAGGPGPGDQRGHAQELGGPGTPGPRRGQSAARSPGDRSWAELVRENAELQMQPDVLKRSVALWVQDAMGR